MNTTGVFFCSPRQRGPERRVATREDCEQTPLWLQLRGSRRAVLNEVEKVLDLIATDAINFPVRLKTEVLYEDVLADVVSQLKRIAEAIEAAPDEE